MKRFTIPTLAIAALVMVGCTNPFVSAYTGDQRLQLADDAEVQVVGADRDDPNQAERFNRALAEARANHKELGSSSFITSSRLRDAHAEKAARELGADLVFYNIAYDGRTTELDSFGPRYSYRYRHGHYGFYAYPRRHYTRTRHWYQYRAYFFDSSQ